MRRVEQLLCQIKATPAQFKVKTALQIPQKTLLHFAGGVFMVKIFRWSGPFQP
jgi:hypothetical protein